MRIGYACLTRGVVKTDFKSCVLKNATESRLKELISYNLNSLENIIEYNTANGIQVFRISSDIIPFGSSQVNELKWWEIFEAQLHHLGNQIKRSGIRVSMHPGQYTVLNSPDDDVVERAIQDLKYHSRFLDSLGVDHKNKIILHVGGVYGNKEKAIEQFYSNYKYLNEATRKRLVIENDDKSYHIKDVLSISKRIGTPVVFDNLHHSANPAKEKYSQQFWINECRKTWKPEDGPQKIHYSQQNPDKKIGSHSENVRIDEFLQFIHEIGENDLDIMLEVKDKNISAIKCINCLIPGRSITDLELEWNRYKYSILEKSHKDYWTIRTLLKDKRNYPAYEFYRIIEEALLKSENMVEAVNAAMHVWGCFKDVANTTEKKRFLKLIEEYQQSGRSIRIIKNFLWKLSEKYKKEYLLNSYYFTI